MKLQGNEKITAEVGTYIGTLTWIDWEHNVGRALLDARPGAAPVEVACTFRFAGQHWIWNMDAYPEEDIASHSAFAFCTNDRVILLHPVPQQKILDPASGQMVPDPESPRYAAVAILKEEEGAGGAKITSIDKRKVWPLYRLGHEAVVLNFKYSGLDGKGAGFPFIADGTRSLVGAFADQRGHQRAFGTPERDGGTGNTHVVVTKERDENDETIFVPHAIHEFCEPGEDIPYVPDVLMQTAPNYRGRIVGWSDRDEVLIDNIPVARVTGAAENLESIVPSWKAVTRKFVVLDETRNTLSVLYVTMDCNYDWRPRAQSGTPGGAQAEYWYPPKYAFYVQAGTTELGSLCIYAAMETPRDDLPEIVLRPNEEMSWLWTDLQRQEPNYILDNQADTFSNNEVEVYASGTAVDAEMFFWGGVVMTGTAEPGRRRKIGLRIRTAGDGSLAAEKSLGELELYAPFDEGNLISYVTHNTAGDIDQDVAELQKPVEAVAATLGQSTFSVRVSGYDRYRMTGRQATYDTDLRKAYIHRGPQGAFIIAEEKQILTGSNNLDNGDGDNVRATMSMIIFTHVDLRHGIYGYWEVIWLDDVRCRDIYPLGGSYTGRRLQWHHYVTSQYEKFRTHQAEMDIPYGDGNDRTLLSNLCPLTRLVSFSDLNNPGVPGFTHPRWHYCHNIWNLPRLVVDGQTLGPSTRTLDIEYKRYLYAPPYHSRAVENDIYTWLQGTTTRHGTKRKSLNMAKSGMYNFSLTPLRKDVGIWPYYKNICAGYVGDYLYEADPTLAVDFCRSLGAILYSECMEYTGAAYGYGEFSYNVKFLQRADGTGAEVGCRSSGYERLPKCTGRDDATIGVD